MMKTKYYDYLDYYIPNPKCELNYTKDYELLIATILSAQCTDKRVNEVTKVLFKKYDLNKLADAKIEDIINIIKSCGSYNKKALYIKTVARSLIDNYDGIVPNDRKYLESLPGVGRKTCNVLLKNIYNEPCIAVDTHVIRVSNRLNLSNNSDPLLIEKDLSNQIPKDKWNRVGEQLLLFGRYYCKSKNPCCDNCLFKKDCKKTE